MDVVQLLISLLGSVGSFPPIAKYLAYVVLGAGALQGIVTGLVGLWHSLVLFFNGLAKLPYLGFFQKVADFLSTEEAVFASVSSSWLIPILTQLSAIPVPKK